MSSRWMVGILLFISTELSQGQSGNQAWAQIRPDKTQEILSMLEGGKEFISAGFSPEGGKCGLWVSAVIQEFTATLSESQREELQRSHGRRAVQKDRVIGRFRIYYDTTGFNQPAMLDEQFERIPGTHEEFIDSVGRFFNESWEKEVSELGYDEPPLVGGTDAYEVYVEELSPRFYGQTKFVSQIGSSPSRFTTFIEVDNDFKDFFSKGMAGLKVTAAHEYHHAVQLGSYGFWPSDVYMYEITSTWMEDVVYDEVNDYIQYLKSGSNTPRGQFAYPDSSFTFFCASCPQSELAYSRAIWGLFIGKRYGYEAMKSMWEHMRDVPSLTAIDRSLEPFGGDFRRAFLEFSVWNFHTGPNADTAMYYEEGREYPQIKMRRTSDFFPPGVSIMDSLQGLSSLYLPVCLLSAPGDNCNSASQMFIIVSNLSAENPRERRRFVYEMKSEPLGSFRQLAPGLFVHLDVSDPQEWSTWESIPTIVVDVIPYPNPFILKTANVLAFRLPVVASTTANLSLFTSGMERVFSDDVPIVSPRLSEQTVYWNGRDIHGDPVGTGIYFYHIIIDEKRYQGKFAVVRE